MKNKHFVMINHPEGRLLPLNEISSEGVRFAMYSTIDEAHAAAQSWPMAVTCGYEIFTIGTGEVQEPY